MPFILGQLVYTSLPEVGFKALASAQVPEPIQQAFIQQVVYQHWDSYSPPRLGYRAVYLHQVAPESNLFGWLYNDGLDDTGRSHVPYFVCYYLAERLHTVQLEKIFACLHRGPVALSDRQRLPATLETLITPDLWSYQPARTGVAIPLSIREHSHTALEQGKLLNLFVPAKDENVATLEAQVLRQTEAAQSLEGVTRTQVNSHSDVKIKPLNEVANEPKIPTFSRAGLPEDRGKPQMVKTALLIGVTNYGAGFDSSPGTLKDVEAMKRVLQHPEIGGFAEVRALINPDRQAMAEAIETLFLDCQKDNLVLLYFSGHGVKDDKGKLYLSTCITRKNPQGKLVKSTAVLASFVQDIMNDSRSKQQMVILDCCFSEAFATGISAGVNPKGSSYPQNVGWSTREDGPVDIKHQLGGPGRVILTSSTSTQDSFDQKGADPSTYTYYLVEGLETGAADLNDDSEISIDELHEYTKRRVQQAAPAMQPGIYAVEAGHKILLATAPVSAPKLRYRKEVEGCVNSGEISFVSRSVLDVLRNRLGLVPEEAAAIEAGILRPYQEYQQKLQHYTQVFVEAIQRESSVKEDTRLRLRHFQQTLGLIDTDIAPIEAQITRQIKAVQSPSQVPGWTKAHRLRNEDTTKLLNGSVAASKGAIPALMKNLVSAILSSRQLGTGSQRNVHSSSVLAQREFWLLVGAGTATILALMGIARGLGQWQDSQQLKTIQAFVQEKNYEECITVAEKISRSSDYYTDAQKLLRQCEIGISWKNVQVQTLSGHEDTVWSIAISPDGQTLASGSGDTTIKLWNLQTGELLSTLSRGSDTVWSIAASPDGRTLVSGSGDERIKIWNLQDRKLLRALSGHSSTVRAVAISPDGQTLASSSGDKTIKLWNLQTGELLRTFSQDSATVRTVAISPDGQTLASSSGDKTIKLWNLQTGELLRTLSGHTSRVISIAISLDQQTLVSGSNDNTIKLWNLQTGELLRTLSGHESHVNSVVISPDSPILASGSNDKTIKLWNLQTGELLRTLSGHLEDVYAVTISPDGKTLASGDKQGTIRIWRTIDN